MPVPSVLKYNAPVAKASPSLSADGSEDLAPRYRSSNESKLAAALVAEVAASLALVVEVVADVEDFTTAIKGEPQDGRVKDPRGDM